MGYFSLLWTGLSPSGRAIAIEASPRNVRLIEKNTERNHLSGRILCVPKAAGDRAGFIKFDVGPADQTGWGGVTDESSPTAITVPMVRLDEELAGESRIEVLKIDVEGADTLVLLGCSGLLRERRIQNIYFEQNPERMRQLGIGLHDARKFLSGVGYECFPLDAIEQEWLARTRGGG